LAILVDQFGALKRQIDTLTAQQDELRRQLIDTGLKLIVGEKFVITMADNQRKNTKWAELVKEAGVSQELVDKFTEKKTVTYVTCTDKE
jgi:hypothetical protein